MSWPRSAPNKTRGPGPPSRPQRSYDDAGLTADELERTWRELATGLPPGTARLTRPRASPGTNGHHRRRTYRAMHTAHLNGAADRGGMPRMSRGFGMPNIHRRSVRRDHAQIIQIGHWCPRRKSRPATS
jgi:hypothetical protein